MTDRGLSEAALERIETSRDPASVPELVRTIREQQRALDSLRMSSDVARRDREELRLALLKCQEELRLLREG